MAPDSAAARPPANLGSRKLLWVRMFAMELPNWSQEIEILCRCVAQINNMQGRYRPLYVCVYSNLVTTKSSCLGAIASWKKVMSWWKRNLIFEQRE